MKSEKEIRDKLDWIKTQLLDSDVLLDSFIIYLKHWQSFLNWVLED